MAYHKKKRKYQFGGGADPAAIKSMQDTTGNALMGVNPMLGGIYKVGSGIGNALVKGDKGESDVNQLLSGDVFNPSKGMITAFKTGDFKHAVPILGSLHRAKQARRQKVEATAESQAALSSIPIPDEYRKGTDMVSFKKGGVYYPFQDKGRSINPNVKLADGGQLKPISGSAMEVDGNNPNKTDDVYLGNDTYVDDNEVIKELEGGGKIIASDKIKLPGSKISVAKQVAKLEKMKSSDSKFKDSNQLIEEKINKLLAQQEIETGRAGADQVIAGASPGGDAGLKLGGKYLTGGTEDPPSEDPVVQQKQLADDYTIAAGSDEEFYQQAEQKLSPEDLQVYQELQGIDPDKASAFMVFRHGRGDLSLSGAGSPNLMNQQTIDANALPETSGQRNYFKNLSDSSRKTRGTGGFRYNSNKPALGSITQRKNFNAGGNMGSAGVYAGDSSQEMKYAGGGGSIHNVHGSMGFVDGGLDPRFMGVESTMPNFGAPSPVRATQYQELSPLEFRGNAKLEAGFNESMGLNRPEISAPSISDIQSKQIAMAPNVPQTDKWGRIGEGVATYAPDVANMMAVGNIPEIAPINRVRGVNLQRATNTADIRAIKNAQGLATKGLTRSSTNMGATQANIGAIHAKSLEALGSSNESLRNLNAQINNQEKMANMRIDALNAGKLDAKAKLEIERQNKILSELSKSRANIGEKFLTGKAQKNKMKLDQATLGIIQKGYLSGAPQRAGIFDQANNLIPIR